MSRVSCNFLSNHPKQSYIKWGNGAKDQIRITLIATGFDESRKKLQQMVEETVEDQHLETQHAF